MTKRVQIAGGNATSQNALIGFEREVTAVEDSHELRLHDGTKVGGFRFLPKETNDQLYGPNSPSLNALAGLGFKSGMIARINDTTWALRNIVGTVGELVVNDGSGVDGNPVLSLPTTINKVGLSFAQSTAFPGGLTGVLTGSVIGNVAGNAVGVHSGSFVGNVDIRGATLQTDLGQIPISALASLPVLAGDLRLFPSGGIILWSGSVATIPAGWVLCDGLNGTPDLRNRFVIGASTTGGFVVGATGGAETHNHVFAGTAIPGHVHAVTVDSHALTSAEMPAHEHGSGYGTNTAGAPLHNQRAWVGTDRFDNNNSNPSIEAMTDIVGGGQGHSHTASSGNAGGVTPAGTINVVDHKPPYYALAYIMKT